MSGAAAGAAAVAAAIANAIKASGVIVRVKASDFQSILGRAQNPLVVYTRGGLFSTNHQYLTSYKGLAFYTKSVDPVTLPPGSELVVANKIWLPG